MAYVHTEIPTSGQAERRASRWAWLIAVAALSVAGMVGDYLNRAGVDSVRILAAAYFAGVLGGFAWQSLNRRDFVERFIGWAGLITFVIAVAAVAGLDASFDAEGIPAVLGLLSGVLLAESWLRTREGRRTALAGRTRRPPRTSYET